ncbi:MAG: alpha/beta fold hydrolase [Betaproteobacteria bacterium]|nr:alpha/beta fold hydrolase [Betaproteobacteria bacterium]NDB15010.1 alpha/beta fold hydrolase [Betaproteobacteria bacterium]
MPTHPSTTLVFVHGFTCDGSDWAAQLSFFGRQCPVWALDLPGHGHTPADERWTLEALAESLWQQLDAFGIEHAALVGHSMGCRVILEAASQRPSSVAALMLVDGSRNAPAGPRQEAQAMALEAMQMDGFKHFLRSFFEAMFTDRMAAHQRRAILERSTRMRAEDARALRASMTGWDAAVFESALGQLARYAIPLSVIQTTRTDASGRHALAAGESMPYLDNISAIVPQADICVMPGQGHFPQIESAEDFNRLLQPFVNQHCLMKLSK